MPGRRGRGGGRRGERGGKSGPTGSLCTTSPIADAIIVLEEEGRRRREKEGPLDATTPPQRISLSEHEAGRGEEIHGEKKKKRERYIFPVCRPSNYFSTIRARA